MPEINLLNNNFEKKGPFSLSGRAGLWSFYISIGVLVLLVLVYIGLNIYNRQIDEKINTAQQQAASVEFEVSKMDSDRKEALSFQRRLYNLQVLLNKHLLWSPVFDELENFTLSVATYDSLSTAEYDNKLILSGIAPSFTDLAKLIRGLELSENVEQVDLISSSQSQEELAGINFNIEVIFDRKLLENQKNDF